VVRAGRIEWVVANPTRRVLGIGLVDRPSMLRLVVDDDHDTVRVDCGAIVDRDRADDSDV
jgi:hypothetical protein